MDSNAAMKQISELESKIRELREEVLNKDSCIVNYEAFLTLIPNILPNGEPVSTPVEWLSWARKKLGYNE